MNVDLLLKNTKQYLTKVGFTPIQSPGLLQPKFGYAFSPSAGHHIIDGIVISEQEPQSVQQFATIPDRSMRTYDFSKIGISSRHLSFFETLVFGYVGTVEDIPKKDAVTQLYNLFLEQGLDSKKLLVTTFGSANIEGTSFTEEEDQEFYNAWVSILTPAQVKRTTGRRNFFYSRVIGNPGGTGCELYYQIGKELVEIGSQVFYRFKFTGGLERTRNSAILQGFGLERLLMALEQNSNIGQISLFQPINRAIRQQLNEDTLTTNLFNESVLKIADHLRAICFIQYDSQGHSLSNAQNKILRKLKRETLAELEYLGISQNTLLNLIKVTTKTYSKRYPNIKYIIKNHQSVLFYDIVLFSQFLL